MPTYTSIDFTPTLKITNVESLPAGRGAKFLQCICGPDLPGTPQEVVLIAKRWCRKHPGAERGCVVVKF